MRTDTGALIDASMRGKLKIAQRAVEPRSAASPVSGAGSQKLAVGDDVLVEADARGEVWAICEVLPRRSQLARRAPGGAFGERIVAANIDQVVIVFAAARPDPHPRMLDRFLVIAEANGLPAQIVLNKVDLVGEEEARRRFAAYAVAGYQLRLTSTKAKIGLEGLRDSLASRTSVFTGPSGVGKSSLLNALFPGLSLRVGEISESVNKGRHTTVGALMVPLPADEGGYVVDTPGLREVGMWGLPPGHLDLCFPEFERYRGKCRFQDCTHTAEPNCAVKSAVATGAVNADRYDSYVKLLGELESAES